MLNVNGGGWTVLSQKICLCPSLVSSPISPIIARPVWGVGGGGCIRHKEMHLHHHVMLIIMLCPAAWTLHTPPNRLAN